MGEIKAGDVVLDDQGLPVRVLYASPITVKERSFDVVFDDGSVIRADGDHNWFTWTKAERLRRMRQTPEWRARRAARRKDSTPTKGAWTRPDLAEKNRARARLGPTATGAVRTTDEIAATLRVQDGREVNHAVLLPGALRLPPADLPVPPYVLGAWLGDGSSRDGGFTSADPETIEEIRSHGYEVSRSVSTVDSIEWHIRGLIGGLRSLGVLGNKHVPAAYLRGSAEQRLALLQGLMDTDGCCNQDGQVEFTSTARPLAEAVWELALSLGVKPYWDEGRARLNGYDHGPKWRVKWTGLLPCFRLARKAERLPKRVRPTQEHRFIVEVRPAPPTAMRCIAVDNESHLYLAGPTMIPTHNTALVLAETLNRCLRVPGMAAVIFRRTYPELSGPSGLISRMLERIPPTVGTYNVQERRWTLANGSTITLSYLETFRDVQRWMGLEVQLMVFDQVEQIDEGTYEMVRTSLRVSGPLAERLYGAGYRPSSIATANPGGIGHQWIKRRFIDPHPRGGVLFRSAPTTTAPVPMVRCYVPSRLEDNPTLDKGDPNYRRVLEGLEDPADRAAQLEGDWSVFRGARFGAFRMDVHAADATSLEVPRGGGVVRALGVDYGSDHPFVALWGCVLADQVVIYREVSARGLTPAEQATLIRASEDSNEWGAVRPTAALDPACWAAPPDKPRPTAPVTGRGMTVSAPRSTEKPPPGSIADTYAKSGVPVQRADNRRLEGVQEIARLLQVRPDGRPGLLISDACPNLLRTLPMMMRDPKRPEDYKKVDGDDWCFIAGTEVATEHGPVPIEEIREGDLVWTRDGLRPVLAAGPTGVQPVFTLALEDGRTLTGTGDHPIWSSDDGAWRRLDALRYSDTVLTWSPPSSSTPPRSSGVACASAATPLPSSAPTASTTSPATRTRSEEWTTSTGRFGRPPTGAPSLPVTTSTTLTTTPTTTTRRTSSSWTAPSTSPSMLRTGPGTPSTWSASGLWLPPGTAARRGGPGTSSMVVGSGRTAPPSGALALSAAGTTRPATGGLLPGSARTPARPRPGAGAGSMTWTAPAPSAAAPSASTATASAPAATRVVRVAPNGTAMVYSLEVADRPEFFANGVLVHNCDALRYLLMRLRTATAGGPPSGRAPLPEPPRRSPAVPLGPPAATSLRRAGF